MGKSTLRCYAIRLYVRLADTWKQNSPTAVPQLQTSERRGVFWNVYSRHRFTVRGHSATAAPVALSTHDSRAAERFAPNVGAWACLFKVKRRFRHAIGIEGSLLSVESSAPDLTLIPW